jgi:methionine-rich copper-binding protein CopC
MRFFNIMALHLPERLRLDGYARATGRLIRGGWLGVIALGAAMNANANWMGGPPSVASVSPILHASLPVDPFRPRPALPIRLAHAILVKAQPDKEAVLTDAPEEVLLVFNEGVAQEFMALAVVDESGKRVDKHDVRQDFTDRSHLRASVGKLPPGRYMVRYRVLSADGHVVSGKYFFRVQAK